MKVVITQQDLMMGQLVPKGWQRAKCTKFESKSSGAGDSTNFIPNFVISEGPYMGKLLKKYFNTKAPGNFVQLMVAVGEEVGPGSCFDSDVIAGKMENNEFWIEITQGTYEGRLVNNIEGIIDGNGDVPYGG